MQSSGRKSPLIPTRVVKHISLSAYRNKRAIAQNASLPSPRVIEVPSHPPSARRKRLGQGAHQRTRKRAQKAAETAHTSAKSQTQRELHGTRLSRAPVTPWTSGHNQPRIESHPLSVVLTLSPLAPSTKPFRAVSIPELIFTPLKKLPTPSELFSPDGDTFFIPVDSSPEEFPETPTASPSHIRRRLAF